MGGLLFYRPSSIVKEEGSRFFSGSYYTFIRQRTCELWELFIFYVVQVIFKYDNGLRFSTNFLEMIFGKNSKSFEIYATRMEKMTTVVHSGEPLGKRVRRKYPDREPSHLVESRFGSFLFFFSFVLFACLTDGYHQLDRMSLSFIYLG